MKIIVREDVNNIGNVGEVVKVAAGYARNFLIPKGYAVEANTKNMRALEHEKRIVQERAKKLYDASMSFAEKISAAAITLKAKVGEEEKLFGSITSMDIADALKEKGIEVDKKKIILEEPIKRLGSFEIAIKVDRDVTATINLTVEAE